MLSCPLQGNFSIPPTPGFPYEFAHGESRADMPSSSVRQVAELEGETGAIELDANESNLSLRSGNKPAKKSLGLF